MNEVRHFHHIKQKFSQPIINSYGKWSERESIVLFTQFHDGSIAFGEVTPTPGFLSLDFENAIQESKKWQPDKIFMKILPGLIELSARVLEPIMDSGKKRFENADCSSTMSHPFIREEP